jgi:hypothetical protein
VKKSFSIMLGVGFVMLQGCVGADHAGDANEVAADDAALSSSCSGQQGIHPTKAALAVAMAEELGRWDPLHDLVKVGSTNVALSSSAVCIKNSCKKTKAILGQQYFTPDQNKFSATSYASDLWSSFNRQADLIANLTMNDSSRLPPAHKLTPVGSMTLTGNCGPHYIFQVDNIDGTALTSAQASNMSNALCYFGQDTGNTNCGSNPFVGFTQTQVNCPSGRVCVAIDPDDGDAGSTSTTTAAGAPTYTLNRLWDPDNAKLDTPCTKTSGPVGTMQSKCATYPSTCGYLYCM